MTEHLIAAAHLHERRLFLIGIYTTFEKAIKACDDFHIANYEGIGKLNWKYDYDGEDVYLCSGVDAEGYNDKYICECLTLDSDFDQEIADYKRKRAE